ncbi:MAG: hypothetical protein ACT4P6_12485 [Gemmatimonadaceae bacterium]
MFRNVQPVLGAIALVIFGLSLLARRLPNVEWLQHFRFDKHLTEEQKARMRRRANVHAGVELILLGVILPLGYVALTVMFFNSFTPMGIALTLAGSGLCIALGVTAIARRNRH